MEIRSHRRSTARGKPGAIGLTVRSARCTVDCGNESPAIPSRPTRILDPSTFGIGMAPSTTQIPRLFKNLRGWLTLIVIFAAAGAILGSPGRGPVSEEDTSWHKWAAIVALWAVYGGLIGAMTHWRTGQFGSYRRAIVSFAIFLPVLLVFVELLRVLAAWYISGWERNVTSVEIGALVGITSCPIVIILFAALDKVLALMFPLAATDRAPDSGSPG
jgi:hypothetical protein